MNEIDRDDIETPRRLLLTVALIGVIARVAFYLVQSRYGILSVALDASDSEGYLRLAQSLLEHRNLLDDGEPTAYEVPGYPLFLAALALVSEAQWWVIAVQSVLGGASAVMLAATAFRLAGKPAAWVAGLSGALYPHLVFWSGFVLTETLYVFFISAGVFWACRALEGSRASAVLAGAALGLAGLVRAVILGFALLFSLGLLIRQSRRGTGLVSLIALVVVVSPWLLRNAIQMGAPVMTTESSYVLWQGNSPDATGGTRGYVDTFDFRPLDVPSGYTEMQTYRLHLDRAVDWMSNHPTKVIALVPLKLWNMWRPVNEGASTRNWATTLLTYIPLLVGGLGGTVVLLRRHHPMGWFFAGFIAYHLLFHGVVTGMIRFRVPVEAVLTVPAGVAVAAIKLRGSKVEFVDR